MSERQFVECVLKCFRMASLLVVFTAIHRVSVTLAASNRTTIYAAGFFPLSNEIEEGSIGRGVLPAVNLALEHINNSPVLRGYFLELKYNDTKCNTSVGMRAFFEFLFEKPRKVMFFGDACNQVTEPIAKAAKFFQVIQLSYADTDPRYNAEKLPNLFRVVPSESASNPARVALLKKFNWARVGTIYQNSQRYGPTHNKMLTDLDKEKIEIALTQSVSEEITPDIQKFKESDVRIILGNFNEEWARYIFCQAYKLGITGRKYQWILAGEYRERWWNKKDASMNCTHSELMTALEGYIATDVLPLSTSHKITVSGMTAYEYHGAYDERRKHEYSKYHGYAYDGIWTIAFAIQYVNLKLSAKNRSLSLLDFDYRNPFWADLFREALNHTFFVGVTGNVTFEGNERKGSILVKRFEGGKEVNIGEYHSMTGELHLKPINWPGGAPPVDRTRKKIVASRVSLTLFIVISVFAVIGIILALVFLTMNIRYRKQRYIKMSSPYLNNLIIIGCILTYTSVITLGLDSRLLDEQNFPYICAARAWVLMTGFTLAFGSMFSKTWRVHAIFTNIKLNKKVIKDYKLFMVVGILVFIDVVTLTTWQIVDPFYRDVSLGSAEPSPESDDILIVPQMEYCQSKMMHVFLGCIYVYKGLLMAFGCFLAWETRHVSIPALNDSKYIGMSVYNVVIMCVIGAGLSFVLREQQDAAFVIISIFIIFCSTATLCLVFVPKLIELKRHPDGDDRRVRPTLKPFKKSRRDSDEMELHTRIKLLTEVNLRQRQRLKEKTYELEALLFRLRQLGVEEECTVSLETRKETVESTAASLISAKKQESLRNIRIHSDKQICVLTEKESSSQTKSGRDTSYLSLSASASFVSSGEDGFNHKTAHTSCPELQKASDIRSTQRRDSSAVKSMLESSVNSNDDEQRAIESELDSSSTIGRRDSTVRLKVTGEACTNEREQQQQQQRRSDIARVSDLSAPRIEFSTFESDDTSYAKAIKNAADRQAFNGFSNSSCEEEDTDHCESTATFSEEKEPWRPSLPSNIPNVTIRRQRAQSLGALQTRPSLSVIGTNQATHTPFLGAAFPYFHCIPHLNMNQDLTPNLPIFSSYPSIKCDIVEYL